jgi:beta-lactamase class A
MTLCKSVASVDAFVQYWSRMRSWLLVLVIGFSITGFAQQKSTTSDSSDELLWKKLQSRVEEIDRRFDGIMGLAIFDLTDGRLLTHNADQVFATASSIKLAILLELYRQDQDASNGGQGKAKLNDLYTFDPKDLIEDSKIMAGLTPGISRLTNRDLAQFMVAVSDNAAANILYDRVGKENVNAMLRSLGLTKTMLRRKMIDLAAARRGDENVATAREMVMLLDAIYKNKVLSKENTAEFIKQLSTLKKNSYISTLLPGTVQVADKPGDLDAVRTDSGIVFVPNRPFVISVMTAWDRDETAAERAISEVALEAFRYFDMRGKTSEFGRVLPPAR